MEGQCWFSDQEEPFNLGTELHSLLCAFVHTRSCDSDFTLCHHSYLTDEKLRLNPSLDWSLLLCWLLPCRTNMHLRLWRTSGNRNLNQWFVWSFSEFQICIYSHPLTRCLWITQMHSFPLILGLFPEFAVLVTNIPVCKTPPLKAPLTESVGSIVRSCWFSSSLLPKSDHIFSTIVRATHVPCHHGSIASSWASLHPLGPSLLLYTLSTQSLIHSSDRINGPNHSKVAKADFVLDIYTLRFLLFQNS